MKKFIALYKMPLSELDVYKENSTEDPEEVLKEWQQWKEANKKNLIEPGRLVGVNKQVTKNGITDRRNELCAYAIVQAETHEAACKIFSDDPHFKAHGAYIEVTEIIDM